MVAAALVAGLAAGSAQAQEKKLGVTLIGQQTDMWCWATSGQMIMGFGGTNVTQCSEANAYLLRNDCCTSPTPAACIKGGWPEYDRWNYFFVWTPWGNALTFAQLRAEIDAGRPVGFAWGWTGGGGHYMVANGYKVDSAGTQWVWKNDPWPVNVGAGSWITYADFVGNADHATWENDYTISRLCNGANAVACANGGVCQANGVCQCAAGWAGGSCTISTTPWVQVTGPAGATLKQVSVGSANAIWGLDTSGRTWKWNGTGWDQKGCCVSQISVTADGTMWATNPPDSLRVLKWSGTAWTWNIPTGMKQVAGLDTTNVWGLGTDGSLNKLNGAAWDRKGCCVSQISAGADGELWATNPPDSLRVLRWSGTAWTWNIPTGMVYVAVGSASNIWGLDGSDKIYQWSGSAWTPVSGALHQIAAAGDGTVWGLNAQGVVYRYTP